MDKKWKNITFYIFFSDRIRLIYTAYPPTNVDN